MNTSKPDNSPEKQLSYKPSSRAAYTSNAATENKEQPSHKNPKKNRRRLSETQLSLLLGKEIKLSQNAKQNDGSDFLATLVNNYIENDKTPAAPPKDKQTMRHINSTSTFFKKKPQRQELHSKTQDSNSRHCIIL